MSEHIVSLRTCMQILPARQPVVVLENLEEHPEWSEILVIACVQTKLIYRLILQNSYGPNNKALSKKHVKPFILCGLKF